MKLIILLSFLCFLTLALPGKTFAGQIHYSRIPVQYWDHRLKMTKALGMNALSVYVMWNYHQVQPGVFDFQTENRNLSLFLQIAQKNNFTVFIRPGPYVCAEWDLGGIPSWLLQNDGINLRSTNPIVLSAIQKYFEAISVIIKRYSIQNGGPITLLQIQNQYGFYGNDMNYINTLRSIWAKYGVTLDQYHADPSYVMANSHWSGANIGVNGGTSESDYQKARQLQPNAFIFGGQIYPGWLTHWGQNWAGRSIESTVQEFSFLIHNNHSFSMYMVHGGSNFGFTAGANQGGSSGDYAGHVTSYDYDAPINQQGSSTAKFDALRQLFLPFTQWEVPNPPAPLPTIQIKGFTPGPFASILQNLPNPIKSDVLNHFQSKALQMYNQGIVVYQTTISNGQYTFDMIARDYAIVFLDGNVVNSYDRSNVKQVNISIVCKASTCKLQILVEAMGHINFGGAINNDRKGLIQFKKISGPGSIVSWNHYKIKLDDAYIKSLRNYKAGAYPVFSRAFFSLQQTGDTFFNMKLYGKGYIWINGRNLGRYWNKGPQLKLFCPGVWLKKNNEIIILQLANANQFEITGDKTLKLSQNLLRSE